MNPIIVSRLRRDASFSGERIQLTTTALELRNLSQGQGTALKLLAEGDHDDAALAGAVTTADGEAGLLRWHMLFRGLNTSGLLEHAAAVDGTAVARLFSVGRGPTLLAAAPTGPVRLSRFAEARVVDGTLTLQTPGRHLAVELMPQAAGLLGELATWNTSVPAPVLRLLATAGLLAPGGPDEDVEVAERPYAQWHPADLAFHSRTRFPASVGGYGGTYPIRDRFAPEPVSPPPAGTRTVALPVPDLDEIAAGDPSLTEVLERRRSIRAHDQRRPITLAQLGELLYRSLRRRGTMTGGDGQELADRPYPSGGAVHELEVYPLVTVCEGLAPGLWHYATDRHELELVAEPGKATEALVGQARGAAMLEADPQVVLLVAARFGRVMWKYETVAYPLVLKHVGVLYQTLYLVATAMDLAVCGLGGGDAAAFATASGRDPLLEGTVGELVLGSRPRTEE
ncbi:SagB family peptide dehydrogenase [Streptosporangium amethystogenes subsp. fukuiense]|uniref:SagB family peptide dehydrogenase n=1 Tax=Streptosporangium amethystogenes subsp. fukuiense TaxID=698418 RepID=A0ABW2TF43_9ACTN